MSNPDPVVASPSSIEGTSETVDGIVSTPDVFPHQKRLFKSLSPFWHDRLVEIGLILSMTAYYCIGNQNFGTSRLFHVNPLYSLPFLLLFAALCWYRLAFAVALLPLALPFYPLPKTIFSHYSFSIAEISLGVCLIVALLQLFLVSNRAYYLSVWHKLRKYLGIFAIPILLFFLAASVSVVIAYQHTDALRAFRREVLEPLLYFLLLFSCFRSRWDITRLLAALFGAGLLVALLGMVQYFLFKNQLLLEPDGIRRVHAFYGSANSIGLLFDYILPIPLAFILTRLRWIEGPLTFWKNRLLVLVLCLPLLLILYLSQSRGAWIAIGVAALFIVACSIRSRKALLLSISTLVVVGIVGFFVFHHQLLTFLDDHTNAHGVTTVTKRLYLWQSALNMISASPWLGFGMDNWLCHYSRNNICDAHMWHYWLVKDPITGAPTGLLDEPTLSHPHNVFLHVWVSMGIFGLLAFIALLILFFWLFVRILKHLRSTEKQGDPRNFHLQWMTIGVGAAMVAALVQGQVDSSFLEQDLAFCFWILVAALLLLRMLSGLPWRKHVKQEQGVVASTSA